MEAPNETPDPFPHRDATGSVHGAIAVRRRLGRAPRGDTQTDWSAGHPDGQARRRPSTNRRRHALRDSGNGEALLRRENPRVVFARRWERRHLPHRRQDGGRGPSPYGNSPARERTVDGSRVHSRRTLDAAEGIEPWSAAITVSARA